MLDTLAEFKKTLSSLKPRDLKELEDLLVSLRSTKADGDLNGFGSACKDVFGSQCPPVHALLNLVGAKKLKANVESLTAFLQGLSPDEKLTRIELGYFYRVVLQLLRQYLKEQNEDELRLSEVVYVLKELARYEEAIQDAYPGYRGPMLAMVLRPKAVKELTVRVEPLEPCKCGNKPTHRLLSVLGEMIEYRCLDCLKG